MRVWLHCVHSPGTKKLIFSPDTDIYNIGLAFVYLLQGTEVVVQQTKSLREGSKFLLLHNLFRALENDPDMAHWVCGHKHYSLFTYVQDAIMYPFSEAWAKSAS